MVVIPLSLPLIQKISSVRLFIPADLRPLDNRMAVLKSIGEVKERFPVTVPFVGPHTGHEDRGQAVQGSDQENRNF